MFVCYGCPQNLAINHKIFQWQNSLKNLKLASLAMQRPITACIHVPPFTMKHIHFQVCDITSEDHWCTSATRISQWDNSSAMVSTEVSYDTAMIKFSAAIYSLVNNLLKLFYSILISPVWVILIVGAQKFKLSFGILIIMYIDLYNISLILRHTLVSLWNSRQLLLLDDHILMLLV